MEDINIKGVLFPNPIKAQAEAKSKQLMWEEKIQTAMIEKDFYHIILEKMNKAIKLGFYGVSIQLQGLRSIMEDDIVYEYAFKILSNQFNNTKFTNSVTYKLEKDDDWDKKHRIILMWGKITPSIYNIGKIYYAM